MFSSVSVILSTARGRAGGGAEGTTCPGAVWESERRGGRGGTLTKRTPCLPELGTVVGIAL